MLVTLGLPELRFSILGREICWLGVLASLTGIGLILAGPSHWLNWAIGLGVGGGLLAVGSLYYWICGDDEQNPPVD